MTCIHLRQRHVRTHIHTQDITAHQTAIPHLLLSKSQTAGWGCRSGHSRLTSPPRACLTQICSSPLSLSPSILREKDLQAAVGWRWGRCRPLELMGGPGGWHDSSFGSHAPWHAHVTLLQVIHIITAERVHCPSALLTQRHTSSTTESSGRYCGWTHTFTMSEECTQVRTHTHSDWYKCQKRNYGFWKQVCFSWALYENDSGWRLWIFVFLLNWLFNSFQENRREAFIFSQILFFPSALYSYYSSDLLFNLFFMCFPSLCYSQGALCSFGEKIQTHDGNIFSINEVILQTQKH